MTTELHTPLQGHSDVFSAEEIQCQLTFLCLELLEMTFALRRHDFQLVEAGADDVVTQEDVYEIYTSVPAFSEVRKFLEGKGLSFLSAELSMIPQNKITLPEDKLETFKKMLDKLDENDDVQTVWHNVELPEEDDEE